MDETTAIGLKMPPVISSVAEYVTAREIGQRIEATATCWEDIPDDSRSDATLAWELVEAGQTAWHLPCFHADIRVKLTSIYDWENLEIARFAAKFLLETLPNDPIDTETQPFLESIRDGSRFPQGYVSWCRWPHSPEFYRKTLNWRMVGWAEDAQRERRAEENTHWFMLQTGRGDEYMERKLDRLSVTGENLTE